MRGLTRWTGDALARWGLAEVARRDGRPFVGLGVEEARAVARRRGARLRIIDDTAIAWTMDFDGGRVTAFAEAGVVVRAEVG